MEQQRIENRISELMSQFVTVIESSKAQNHLDTSLIAENVLLPILAKLYDCPNLENANHCEHNFPGVDLVDRIRRIAFQITSTPDLRKVKETLETFLNHNLQTDFDHLYVYIITRKQATYSTSTISNILSGRFEFDPMKQIIDYKDLLLQCSQRDIRDQQFVLDRLEEQFTKGFVTARGLSANYRPDENIISNLLEVKFPSQLYVAELAIDKKEILREGKKERLFRKWSPSERDLAHAALKLQGLSFASDWVCHNNKVLTFHDLDNSNCPLGEIIDEGTIETLGATEFSQIDDDYYRKFTELLNTCLRQELYHRGVRWQANEKLYFFTPTDEMSEAIERNETWIGKKQDTRNVYKPILGGKESKTPGEIVAHKHLAFGVQFIFIGNQWYVALNPDWYFTGKDIYQPSHFNHEQVTNLKRQERNVAVYNHVRFLAYFLKDPGTDDMFSPKRKGFLRFGEIQGFKSSFPLNDAVWLNSESKEKRKLIAEQGDLF